MFKVKYYPNRLIVKYKIRLVNQKYSQILKIDFNKTFVLTIYYKLLRIFLAISIFFKFLIQ